MKNVPARVTALRALMALRKIDACIVPSADPHQSEYVPEHWAYRKWISGFTGSAGTVIVTSRHAGLWTDARYFLQAERELAGTGIQLHKLLVQTQAEYVDWLCGQLKPGQVVGCDFAAFSLSQVRMFGKLFEESQIVLRDTGDLIAEIWEEQPPLDGAPVYEHPRKWAGASRGQKLRKLRELVRKSGADGMLLSALDEIAYLLNLRGNDVRCNPVFVAYLAVFSDRAELFVPPGKVSAKLAALMESDGILCRSYQEIDALVSGLDPQTRMLIDPGTFNARLAHMLPSGTSIELPSLVMLMKAVKSPVEQKHLRGVMVKDGVALVRAFIWLEKQLKKKKSVTEYDFAMQIARFRSLQPHYVGESFDAIVGYRSNGAIIHYKPEAATAARITARGILLVDSGGQYFDGTTDITRTIALSPQPLKIKKHYTAVLMGHIALAGAIFPEGTKGIQLDALARQYLWQAGLNYGHGTGHGVGYFMNVHEPPQGFVTAWNQRGQTPFTSGMLTSNEPGYYEEGSHGIRIENLVLSIPHESAKGAAFLRFDTVTLFPIETSLLHLPMMNRPAVQWLNAYHKEVFRCLAPLLDAGERKWLKAKCKAI
ncbi:MAG: aminopeptidase P family protein [Saprospiraceae bacterium]|nr:aminopeptidase P family protein [Saprospiraceae bacterium]